MKMRYFLSIVLLICVFVYLVILQPLQVWPFTIDDMYISLRYAKHWATGMGLVWNYPAYRVEGYSNFSFVALAALFLKFGFNPVGCLKALGWLSLTILPVAIYWLSRFWCDRLFALLPALGLLLYKGQIIWAISGLETAFYQILVIAGLIYWLKAQGYNFYPLERRCASLQYAYISAIWMTLASLTRPEAPLLMLLFWGVARLLTLFEDASYKQAANHSLGLFLLLYMPYFVWRYVYFGHLLPNPIYCKGLADAFLLLDKHYIQLCSLFGVLALAYGLLANDKKKYYLIAPNLLYLIILSNADPVVAFYNRLFLPVFGLVLVLSVKSWQEIFQATLYTKRLFAFGLFILLEISLIPSLSLAQLHKFTEQPIAGELLRVRLANWLKKNTTKHQQVVLGDSGLVPYLLPDLRFIDSYCLNNQAMAMNRYQHMFKNFCTHILLDKPKFVILTASITAGKVHFAPADACLKNKLTAHGYELTQQFKSANKPNYYRYEIYTALNGN